MVNMFTVAFGKGAGQNKTENGFSHFSAMISCYMRF